MQFVLAMLVGLAAFAGSPLPDRVAAQGLRPIAVGSRSNATGPEMVEILRQLILVGNRGDVNAALAFFSEDAVVIRGARCSTEVPCIGHAAIRVLLESEARNRNSLGFLGTPGVSGDLVTGRLEWWAIPIGVAGTQRLHVTFTATFRGDKIARLVQQLDLSDPMTLDFANLLRTANAVDVRTEALNRGDIVTATGGFTEDAVFEGPGPCSPTPCVGPEAIRRAFEQLAVDRIRFTTVIGQSRTVGDLRTSRVEIRSDSIRVAGVDRLLATLTSIVPGTRISSMRVTLDAADPQTAVFLAQPTPAQVPAQLPKTGDGGLAEARDGAWGAAALGVLGVFALLLGRARVPR